MSINPLEQTDTTQAFSQREVLSLWPAAQWCHYILFQSQIINLEYKFILTLYRC
jgi:hypothetical protein